METPSSATSSHKGATREGETDLFQLSSVGDGHSNFVLVVAVVLELEVIFTSSPSAMVRVLLSETSRSTMPKVAMFRSPLTEALEARASGQSSMPTLVTVLKG